MNGLVNGLVALAWIDLKLYLRNIIATFFTLAFPVLMLLLFGAMFGNAPDPRTGGPGAMDVALPGYIVALVIGSAALMGLPVEIAARRQNGVLRRLRASPLSPASVLGSQLLVALAVSVLGTVLLVLAGRVAWNARLPRHPFAVVPAFLLCCASECALGLLIASVVRSVKAALAVCMAVFYPMMFLSGGTIPLQFLPEGLQRVAAFLPMTWAVTLMKGVWSGAGWDPAAQALLGGLLAIGGAVSPLLLRWD